MEISNPTDINDPLSYSALMKCQNNFRFKVRNDHTSALKIYLKLFKFTM